MKVIAFCGSARKEGNTSLLLNAVLKPLAQAGAETELLELAGNEIRGCMACYVCYMEKNGACVLTKDLVNESIAKMAAGQIKRYGCTPRHAAVSISVENEGVTVLDNNSLGIFLKR